MTGLFRKLFSGSDNPALPAEPKKGSGKGQKTDSLEELTSSISGYFEKFDSKEKAIDLLKIFSNEEIEDFCRNYPIDNLKLDYFYVMYGNWFGKISALMQTFFDYDELMKKDPEKFPRKIPSREYFDILVNRLVPFVKKHDRAQIASENKQELYTIGILLLKQKRYNDALVFLESSYPSRNEDHYFRIAIANYKIALSSKTNSDIVTTTEKLNDIIDGKVQMGDHYIDGARELLRELEDISPVPLKSLTLQDWIRKGTNLLLEENNVKEAISCYDKALEIDQGNEVAWYWKGRSFSASGNDADAIACYDKALEINPSGFEYWFWKGDALKNVKNNYAAVMCYDRALEINPSDDIANAHRTEVIESDPALKFSITKDDPQITEQDMTTLGNKLLSLGKYQQAIPCFEKVLEMNPRSEDALHRKGQGFTALREYTRAKICYEKALEINPRSENALRWKGQVCSASGNYSEAIVCYEKALEINPSGFDHWVGKGDALRDLGDTSGAISCYKKALAINPEDNTIKEHLSLAIETDPAFRCLITDHTSADHSDNERSLPATGTDPSDRFLMTKYSTADEELPIEHISKAPEINPEDSTIKEHLSHAIETDPAVRCLITNVSIADRADNEQYLPKTGTDPSDRFLMTKYSPADEELPIDDIAILLQSLWASESDEKYVQTIRRCIQAFSADSNICSAKMNHKDEKVRYGLAIVLGELPPSNQMTTSAILSGLNRLAFKDSSEFVRREAAHSLGKLKTDDALRSLIKLITECVPGLPFGFSENSRQEFVSKQVAEGVYQGFLEMGKSVEMIYLSELELGRLLYNADWKIRRFSVMILGKIGGLESTRKLYRIKKEERNSAVLYQIESSLNEIAKR